MSRSLIELMRRAAQARREMRYEDAQRDLVEAVALSRQEGDRFDLVRSLKALGQAERDLERGVAALPLYEEALAICREEGDRLAVAHTVRHVGDLHLDTGSYELAEPCYLEALAIYRSEKRTSAPELANLLRALAILAESKGEAEVARSLWTEARDLYDSVGIHEGVKDCKAGLDRLNRDS